MFEATYKKHPHRSFCISNTDCIPVEVFLLLCLIFYFLWEAFDVPLVVFSDHFRPFYSSAPLKFDCVIIETRTIFVLDITRILTYFYDIVLSFIPLDVTGFVSCSFDCFFHIISFQQNGFVILSTVFCCKCYIIFFHFFSISPGASTLGWDKLNRYL